ncbi:dihydroneopterin aldolase [Deinococcus sp. KNUC1210]|uniref:dihydroneopterin aldolase n=1 Tax=Deinococcus sp. KNUC1210 TaxID=2917691 RepID=UPI001EF142D1|nr:dihydroneopterin aldolase [Deinococcus sp. KNUC1210]ULH14992.1 dihydroneopterin aldolase [Deinococcus sp. KNUC1210]
MSSRVVLSGMEFHARHGVYDEEARFGARFVVDVELFWPFAAIPDELDRAVNYEEIYAAVEQETTRTRVQLIEVLTANIARRLLREQPLLESVTVRVHKPHAPLPGVLRDVYAELSLQRHD